MTDEPDLPPPLLAQIDLCHVRFDKGVDMGIEFRHEIDAWKRMEMKFRSSRHFSHRFTSRDLTTLVYAIREKLD